MRNLDAFRKPIDAVAVLVRVHVVHVEAQLEVVRYAVLELGAHVDVMEVTVGLPLPIREPLFNLELILGERSVV